MQLPDYLSSGSAEVFLDGVKFNRQTNDDEETQLGFFDATIDLVLDLTNRTLEDPPRYLRGAAEAVLAAKDGKGSTVVRYAPLDRERSVRLSLNRGIWEAFNDVGAEVRVLEVVATAKSPRFKAKVRVVGLSSVQCGALLECAKRTVHVSFEPVQIALNLVG
jgi:hypothetical protein